MVLLALVACNNAEDESEIRDQINEYREEARELDKKIRELEQKLESRENDLYRVPVRVREVSHEPFNHYFEVSGSVEAVNAAFISPEVSGVIEDIFVKEGEQVSKGQVLVKLATEVTENTIQEVRSSLEYAETVYAKQKRLWDQGIGSEMQYLEAKNNRDALINKLETLRAQRSMAVIEAPINGRVDEIFRKQGELALPGTQLMQLINLDELYVNADVSESYLSVVKEGERVTVSFPVYPALDLKTTVHRVGNVINPGNRTFRLQLKIENPQHKLKPNMLAVIRINDFSTDSAIVVPSNIIKQDQRGQYLYVISDLPENPVAKKVYIETGMSYGAETLVSEGIEKGEKVVTNGYNQVTDGSPVEVRN